MPPQQGKSRTVGLGPGLLGEKAYQREKKRGSTAAIVLGPGILGKKTSEREAKKLAELKAKEPDPKKNVVKAEIKDAKPPAVPKPKKEPTAIKVKPVPKPSAKVGGMSETEARKLLKADPDAWDKVLAVESARPGGIRADVARALINISKLATKNPVPADIMAELEKVAGAPKKAPDAEPPAPPAG